MVDGVANPHEMRHSRSPYVHGRAGVPDEFMDDSVRPSVDPMRSASEPRMKSGYRIDPYNTVKTVPLVAFSIPGCRRLP